MDPKHCDPLFTLKISAACSKGKIQRRLTGPDVFCWLVGWLVGLVRKQPRRCRSHFRSGCDEAGLKTPMIRWFIVISCYIHVIHVANDLLIRCKSCWPDSVALGILPLILEGIFIHLRKHFHQKDDTQDYSTTRWFKPGPFDPLYLEVI